MHSAFCRFFETQHMKGNYRLKARRRGSDREFFRCLRNEIFDLMGLKCPTSSSKG